MGVSYIIHVPCLVVADGSSSKRAVLPSFGPRCYPPTAKADACSCKALLLGWFHRQSWKNDLETTLAIRVSFW